MHPPDVVYTQLLIGGLESLNEFEFEKVCIGFQNSEFQLNTSGCVRLGNPDLDLKIWIFGFPIERKI